MPTEDHPSIELCATQAAAFKFLMSWSDNTPVLHLRSSDGLGKTTILQQVRRETNAYWLDVRPLVAEVAHGHPLAIEEAAWKLLISAMEQHPKIIVDDFNLFFDFAGSCGAYPRTSYYETTMRAILVAAKAANRQLILGSDGHLPAAFAEVAWSECIEGFQVSDYRHLFPAILGRALPAVDFDAVFRFAPNLNCHRIAHLCHWLGKQQNVATAELLDFIQNQGMSSNVEVSEVQAVQLSDLCGVDDVVKSLEDNIIMPMENLQLAAQLGLTPKRGVMLAGPPGTGKTTIGRALARRMRGKFFLIDGTVISGTERFYRQIDYIFNRAINNAPSIVFIDDSDVIFESGREHGLYRYLLTKLDGLESASVSNVCVMMTAMDLGNIPPALVRSGRIELWLEMKLPDAQNRRRLMSQLFAGKVRIENAAAWPVIDIATEGFSGADLKRLVQDAKLQMAVDMTRGQPVLAFDQYLQQASTTIHNSRAAYAKASQRAQEVNLDRPRWFNIHPELFEQPVPAVTPS